MNIFDKLKSKKPVQANDQPTPDTTLNMNEFSTDAIKRTELFESVAKKQGLTILSGRFGGEYNNDMVAIGENGDSFILLFGLKIVEPDQDLQLDRLAMGPFFQTSENWLRMIAYSMRLDATVDNELIQRFECEVDAKTISINLLYLDIKTKDINMLPVEMG